MKKLYYMGQLGRMEVVESNYVSDYETVPRTWRERLFTRPWKPFKKDKVIYSPKLLQLGASIICSPSTACKIRRELMIEEALMKDRPII